jgi:hypothetical protein
VISTPCFRAFIAVVLLFAAPGLARAWTQLGLEGGIVHVIAVDPQTPTTLYAAVYAGDIGSPRGVYKSTNGGSTWTASNTGLVYQGVTEIIVHPQNPSTIYVTNDSGGISRSTNGGAAWSTFGGPSVGGFKAFVIDPVNPAKLYVAVQSGVYRSTNGGSSFTAGNTGLTSLVTRALAVDPVNPAVLYVSTFDGVFKSTNGATSWSPSNTGLPAVGPEVLTVDAVNPSIVYAAGCTNGFAGVYRSIDGGATWNPSASGLPNAAPCVTALAVRPTAPATLFLAARDSAAQTVFKSTDSGATWSPSGAGLEGHIIDDFAFDPNAAANVYAGTQAGFFRSSDGGTSWTLAMSGIRHPYVAALAVDPNAPATMYAAPYADGTGSVAKSIDGGVSWTQIGPRSRAPFDNGALSQQATWHIVVDPTNSLRVYVASTDGVFRSTDGGATWAWAPTQGPAFTAVYQLAVDPLAPSVLYASTQGGGLQKSTDSGATWTVMNSGIPTLSSNSVVADHQHPNTVYAAASFNGVFKSVDGAASWTPVNTGFNSLSGGFSSLLMDPTDANVLYVVASFHAYRTANGGGSWTQTSNGDEGGGQLLIDPVTPTTLYSLDGDVTVNKSVDSGATWNAISPAGLPSVIQTIAIDPSTASTLYAGTPDGVFKSGTSTAGAICTVDGDCNDLVNCTSDICDPADPAADPATGCINAPVVCDDQCHLSGGSCDEQSGECLYFSAARPDGTSCDDGDLCTFNRCLGGACVGTVQPEPSCRVAGTTRFSLRHGADSTRDALMWKWNGSTSFGDLGNPTLATRYVLCVYDRSGPGGAVTAVIHAAPLVGAGDCGGKPCWQAISKGFKYKDRLGASEGVTQVTLKSGAFPAAKIQMKARGTGLGLPALPLAPNVTVQLRNADTSGADCWGADYQGMEIRRNDVKTFKARGY